MSACTKPKDILDELTRDELLAWVRTQFYRLPKRSDILYLRWEQQSAAVLRDMDAENRSLAGINFAEHDRLAKLFNASRNSAEKLELLEQMAPYDRAMADHIKRSQAIERRQKKVDRLYEQIEVERRKEGRA